MSFLRDHPRALHWVAELSGTSWFAGLLYFGQGLSVAQAQGAPTPAATGLDSWNTRITLIGLGIFVVGTKVIELVEKAIIAVRTANKEGEHGKLVDCLADRDAISKAAQRDSEDYEDRLKNKTAEIVYLRTQVAKLYEEGAKKDETIATLNRTIAEQSRANAQQAQAFAFAVRQTTQNTSDAINKIPPGSSPPHDASHDGDAVITVPIEKVEITPSAPREPGDTRP